jgi:adenine-specific DNA methylase
VAEVTYPKRLIEVDLPIRRISAFSRAEKSVRQGHISTMHVWWARRPLAACRAVIAASLWLDPADELAPDRYRDDVLEALRKFARDALSARPTRELLGDSYRYWTDIAEGMAPKKPRDGLWLRNALLEMVATIAAWPAAVDRHVLQFVESITLASQASLNLPGKRPLVFDPFSGGGAMPLEALRVGADAFASDLNPVAVLLNRVALEHAPGRQHELADEIRQRGAEVGAVVRRELTELYPTDPDGSKPIAYLWARTVLCEGPACGKPIPLARSFWLTKRGSGSAGVQMNTPPSGTAPSFTVINNPRSEQISKPTVQRGAAVCPWCGHTTPVDRIRAQLARDHGGADRATLFAVVIERQSGLRAYRAPEKHDLAAVAKARHRLAVLRETTPDLLPSEELPPRGTLGFRVQNYGMTRFEHLYSPRQLVTLATITQVLRQIEERGAGEDVCASLSLALGRMQDLNNSLCRWADTVVGANAGQNRLSMTWDFAEAAPLAGAGGGWDGQVEWIAKVLEHVGDSIKRRGTVAQAPAQRHPLPDDCAALLATDPPYYDAFGYADLADLFFVWLKRATLKPRHRFLEFGADGKTPKALEIVVNPGASADGRGPKDHNWFYQQMREAFGEARRVVEPGGIGVIVFAHKDTRSWEALLSGVIDAGWIVTASWPIDTERPNRQRAIGSAALASSVHLVCRPREDASGRVRFGTVGDWRDVLAELPKRIHDWLPRLADEGVVGADAIFACLGPALEIFSRYSHVEKVSGEKVELREYLEQVWAAVSREALSMIFDTADTAGLEEDARLTAMWLWTLAAPGSANGEGGDVAEDGEESGDQDEDATSTAPVSGGFSLEYDAARKIAQGLGARLDELGHVVEVKGEKARLLPVAERMPRLFGKTEGTPSAKKAARKKQMSLFAEIDQAAEAQGWGEVGAPKAGTTTLDRVHQAMLLFASGRGEALKRFLVDEGVGKQPQFWKLSQSLSALYPGASDEKRWIDGVLARKKGLGF